MNYYFTFGQSQVNRDGIPMKDVWVRVEVKSSPGAFKEARRIFIEKFSSVYMNGADQWGFQYDDKNMNKGLFPAGEWAFIDKKGKLTLHHNAQ